MGLTRPLGLVIDYLFRELYMWEQTHRHKIRTSHGGWQVDVRKEQPASCAFVDKYCSTPSKSLTEKSST